MADFKPTKIDLLTINNGKGEYINGVDSVQADTINAVVEGTAWVQALGTNQPNNSEVNNVGTPSVSIETLSDGTPRLKFSNLKSVVQTKGQSTTAVMSQKTTTDEIDALKSDLDKVFDNLLAFEKDYKYLKNIDYSVTNGTLEVTTTVVEVDSNNRLRTNLISLTTKSTIEVLVGYEYQIYYFNDTGEFRTHTDWLTSKTELNYYNHIRVILRKNDNTNMMLSDWSNIRLVSYEDKPITYTDNPSVKLPIDYLKIGFSFSANDEYYNTYTNRASKVGINLNAGSLLVAPSEYLFALDKYGDNIQSFISIGNLVWHGQLVIPETCEYNIIVKKVDNATITEAEAKQCALSIVEYYHIGFNRVSNLQGKTITAIGDSFIDYNTQGLGNDLLSKIAYGKNMTIHNYGLSSSSLAYDPNQTVLSVMDRYQDMISSVPQTDYLIVLAGHNDSNASLHGGSPIPIGNDDDTVNTTFKGALNILCNALLTAYPSANILFLTPFRRRDTEFPYCVAMEEVCSKYSIPVFNNYKNSGICFKNSAQDALYDIENLHLNALGNERVARKYVAILESM